MPFLSLRNSIDSCEDLPLNLHYFFPFLSPQVNALFFALSFFIFYFSDLCILIRQNRFVPEILSLPAQSLLVDTIIMQETNL